MNTEKTGYEFTWQQRYENTVIPVFYLRPGCVTAALDRKR